MDETIFLNFVELNRFDKSLDDCVDLADKWFYSLKHMGSMDGPDIRTDRASGGRYQETLKDPAILT